MDEKLPLEINSYFSIHNYGVYHNYIKFKNQHCLR